LITNISKYEQEQISNGNWSVLKDILTRERECLRDQCESRKDDTRFYQGQAYHCKQLCLLLGIVKNKKVV